MNIYTFTCKNCAHTEKRELGKKSLDSQGLYPPPGAGEKLKKKLYVGSEPKHHITFFSVLFTLPVAQRRKGYNDCFIRDLVLFALIFTYRFV